MNIEVQPERDQPIRLWIYMAQWALIEDEEEILASDMAAEEFHRLKNRMKELAGASITSADILDGEVLRIGLSGGRRLEIWTDPEDYDPDWESVLFFRDDECIGELKLPP